MRHDAARVFGSSYGNGSDRVKNVVSTGTLAPSAADSNADCLSISILANPGAVVIVYRARRILRTGSVIYNNYKSEALFSQTSNRIPSTHRIESKEHFGLNWRNNG